MSVSKPVSFNATASAFADYGTSLRGFVRYKLTQRYLQPYVQSKPLQILDVGGGSGPDAAWLVGLGHDVTMLEPSREQRQYAQRRFNFFLEETERNRIHVKALGLYKFEIEQQYDMVIIHTVAMLQTDPHGFIRRAAAAVRPGGLLSVVEKGYFGAEAQAVREQNRANIRMLNESQRIINHIGLNCHAFYPAELEQLIGDNGFTVVEWNGIRVLSDAMGQQVSGLRPTMVRKIVDAEERQGRESSVRGSGQLLHFIARKN